MPRGKRPTKRQATPRQSESVPQIKRSLVRGSGTKGKGVVGSTLKEGNRRASKAAVKPNVVEKVPTFGHKVKDTEAAPGPEKKVDRQEIFSRITLIGGIAIAVASLALIVFLILSVSPVFSITTIETQGSEHVSQDSIAKLAQIPAGTTLLNVDEKAVEDNIKKNPWVSSINIERKFPNTLSISVNERTISAIVLMNSGSVAWYLGNDGCWIEPVTLDRSNGQTSEAAALALATSTGCILIKNVPATVQPVAGGKATDDMIQAVQEYQEGFSSAFSAQIVSYAANSVESLSCLLSNGVDVSLGAATSIAAKEAAITTILNEHAGKITYINVRVPSNPTYRSVDSDKVGQGTGVNADTENAPASSNATASTDSSTSASAAATTDSAAAGSGSTASQGTSGTGGTASGTDSSTSADTSSEDTESTSSGTSADGSSSSDTDTSYGEASTDAYSGSGAE